MRVISGTARGKKLHSLEGLETRPTLDRVKEAVFNILQFNLKKCKCFRFVFRKWSACNRGFK